MQDLQTLCTDLFEDSKQSHTALFAGFLDHSARLLAATDLPNAGALGTLVGEAKIFTGALAKEARDAQEALNLSEREQLAVSGEAANARLTAEKGLSLVNALIAAVVPPAEQGRLRTLLFPQQMTQYTNAKLSELPMLLAGFLTILKAQKAAFGAFGDGVVADTEAAFTAFTGQRIAHITEQGDTEKARLARRELRARLTSQLTANYHLLSLCHAAAPEQVLPYFTQRYFERRRMSNPSGERRRTVQANQSQVLVDLDTYTNPDRYHAVQVRLTEGGPARLYRATDPHAPEPANATVLPAGDAVHRFALADLPGTGPKLVLRNGSAYVARVELALLEE